MSNSILDPRDLSTLEYIITHVFCPLRLPDGDDHSTSNDRSLAGAIASVAHLYSDHASQANIPQWNSITRMLDNLQAIVQFQSLDMSQAISQFCSMDIGDVLAFLIRAQNAAVVFRKQKDVTIFESFEVSPKAKDVMTTQGKLICSYPGPAIEIPNAMLDDDNFLAMLMNFLVHMNDNILPDTAATTREAQSTVLEVRDTTHPGYITELLTGILRSVGRPADVVRLSKRMGDDVVWNGPKLPWRRSSLWLLIRVVLQTTLDRSTLGRVAYKEFTLFFMCCLGKEKISADLPNDLLHFMSTKISRRLRKLGSSASDWLSRIVLETCTSLRSTLEARWRQVQAAQRVSPLWNPFQLDLNRDVQLSLLGSGDYIRNCLANYSINPPDTAFSPTHRPRGGLDEFLSSDGAFFKEAYRTDPHVTLYDVEREVEQGIDDWVGRVTNNDEGCMELEILANKYSLGALRTYAKNPEFLSVMLLTTIELWVALDKIAIKETPMLADYSPEIPTSLLEDLLLCKTVSLDRLRHAHQYLSRRHSQSNRGWSVFSPTATENSFAVRYYRGSSRLQHLKTQIEKVARREVREKIAELKEANARHTELQEQATEIDHTFGIDRRGAKYHTSDCRKCDLENQQKMEIAVHEWPLPAEQLNAEAVVFELDCPVSFNMWRNATFHLLLDLGSQSLPPKDPYLKLDHYYSLRPYLVQHARSRISLGFNTKSPITARTTPIPTTQECVCVNNGLTFYGFDNHARIPVSEALGHVNISRYCTYQLQSGAYQNLQKYVDTTSHTSNEILANQVDCHKDLSIHEFMAFGHLRSGGLLQWLNILRELRSRSLTFRRHEVHSLIAQAVSQVGPLANTDLAWHQEIQQPAFCYALLGELESLVRDVEANWLEGVTMDTISFLLRRLLTSSPDQAVSLKVLGLLRTVRSKVFNWMEELSAKLTRTPEDEEFHGFSYQTYRVDTDLGCLAGTVSLTNKLYCAYLHALTSGCGADPLTGRSGTEEALSLLRSASCWSIMKFSSRDAELLSLIASMCPSRAWYPTDLTCMQKVDWLDLPANSRHHELYVVAKAIKAHYERLQLFHESQSNRLFQAFPSHEVHLLERSARRAAYLFPVDLSWKSSSANRDVRYPARDIVKYGSGEHRAYTAATTVYRRTANATTTKDILSMVESWTETVSGDTTLSLQYDRSWLAPDLPKIWLKAYNLLRGSDEEKWSQLLFSLPAMAYASPNLSDLVPVLVAFASHPQFCSEDPPYYDSYSIADEYHPSSATLRSYVAYFAYPFEHSPEGSEPARYHESLELRQRQVQMYNTRLDSDSDATINQLLRAWSCETPPGCSLNLDLYDVASFTSKVESHFSSCYRNRKLKEHLTRVQEILGIVHSQASPTPTHQYSFDPSQTIPSDLPWTLTVDQLFSRPEPSLRAHDRLPRYAADVGNTSLSDSSPLRQLIATAEANAGNPFQHQYVSALRASAECFRSEMSLVAHEATKLPDVGTLIAHYTRCRANYIEGLQHLQRHLGPRSQSEQTLEQSGQWPRITAHVLLRFLASGSPIMLSDDSSWKGCLVGFALLVLELQRSRRLLRLHLDNHHEELRRELQNEGCDGWNAEMHPDWLLIQLQGNFFVRRVQAEVANEMISPHSGSGDNIAMQLNMGEGKSSVIVPIVVVVLANSEQLVRVIVPKALTAQMFHLLVDRLAGLTNRRIYFLPFSRSLKVNRQKAAALHEIMLECMEERGILVVQPEHVLSLKLVSVEKQLPQEEGTQVALPLLKLQRWLHSRSRDILDESDEILHVRYQMVYTIGDQQHMEGFPERWTTTQQILSLVNKHASSLRNLFPHGVEYQRDLSGSFPHIRILHADAGQNLISWIVQDVIDGVLPSFSFGQLRSDLKDAIRSFISCEDVPPAKVQLVKEYSQESSLWGGLLLLRGLLTTGILLFAFRERRWRVDYGLAPMHTMFAVPYRAKDVPAQRAEFGHSDVAIILTCLSYYYGGLNEEQLKASFEMLLKQDDPSVDYDLWVRECSSVPESLLTLNGINIKSSEQWDNILLPLFSRNKATVDFYLSRVVFPREAKEFPSKLSCSGWDLAEKRERLLTGFSGTNDGQYLLPLHITQRDPDHQRGTNAKVLSYLLQPENKDYMCMTPENGEWRTTHEFLKMLVSQKPEIRVLLDAGAQMLELQNCQLAQAWLDISPDASAAIYFNEDDELTVLTRDGNTQLLLSSPFAQQLDQCVVYLDDAHTRGTDIKFPSGFRAAVTLGPKVTKYRLAQGCMRMRKLGHGHSVMFFAPREIDLRIRSVAIKGPLDDINTMDILRWTIRETCDDIQQRAPHWAQQGMDHTSRYVAWSSFCKNQLTSKKLLDKWLQPEAKTLEDLYRPNNSSRVALAVTSDISQRCEELGILSLRNVIMDEEQEREVIHEAECERQVERPPRVPPAIHSIHQDIVTFVKTGIVPSKTNALHPAFETLDATSAANNEAHVWSSFVLATTDFQNTVRSSNNIDDYLRPIQWIVSGKRPRNEVLVLLSPYEVNHLIPDIRSSDYVHLHLYTPRVTKSMKPCDDLALYTIPMVPTGWTTPSLLMDQLNVFSGQLYLKDYETYIQLCRFLCVYARDLEGEEGIEVGSNGFIAPRDRPRHLQNIHTFQNTPLLSLRKLMGFRRQGMCFALTHMGKLLDGRLLSEDEFDV